MAKALVVQIVADAKQFYAELDKAAGKTRQMGKVAGVAGLAIAGGLAYGLEQSVKAAVEGQASTARLAAAWHDAGLSATKYAGQIGKAEAAGVGLGFSNIDVRDSLGSLGVATKSASKSFADLQVAENLARFSHKSLTDATKTLSMAMAGSQRGIHQLGLQMTPITTQAQKVAAAFKVHSGAAYTAALATAKLADKTATANKVIALVSKNTKGAAEAFAGTAAGGMAKFHAAVQALMENLGTGLIPILTKLVGELAVAAQWLSQHTTIAKILVIGLGTLAAALMAVSVATTIATAAATAFEIATSPITAVVLAVVAAIGALAFAAYEVYKHWGAISAWFGNMWGEIKAIFFDAIHWVENNWQYFLGLPGLIYKNWGTISGWFGKLWGGITGAFGSAISWIESKWGGLISWMKEMIRPLVDAYNAIFGSLTGNIPLSHDGSGSASPPVGVKGPAGSGSASPPVGVKGPAGRANGGPVLAGLSYIVGERGPELFTPGRSGAIVPNHKLVGRTGPPWHNEGPRFYKDAFHFFSKWAVLGHLFSHLGTQQEKQFRHWVRAKNVPFDPDAKISDYDMRGYWAATKGRSWAGANAHFPDTWKTPYDTTFSRESKYATKNNPFDWKGNNLVNLKTGRIIFSPRAKGGPVLSGLSYLVGERGPELFTPGRSGAITPNHALGGSTVNVGPVIVHGSADAAFAKQLAAELATQLRGGRVPALQQAIAAV